MDSSAPLKFFSASHATWVDMGGRYLVLREEDIKELRSTITDPEIQLQSMSLSHEQAHAILGHFE